MNMTVDLVSDDTLSNTPGSLLNSTIDLVSSPGANGTLDLTVDLVSDDTCTIDLVSSPGANGTLDLPLEKEKKLPTFAVNLATRYPSPAKLPLFASSTPTKSPTALRSLPDSPHGSHSSEDIGFSSDQDESEDECPGAPAKRPRSSFAPYAREEICSNANVLGLKCSEAFRLVQECEGIRLPTSARYEDTFFPMLVEFVRSARDLSAPVVFSERIAGSRLKDCLSFFLKKPAQRLDWMPDGDITVQELFDKAFYEAYADASRLGDLSHSYVCRAVTKVAKKLIACCVRLNDKTRLARECVRVNLLLVLVAERVEEDSRYKRDCENHKIITQRALSFDV